MSLPQLAEKSPGQDHAPHSDAKYKRIGSTPLGLVLSLFLSACMVSESPDLVYAPNNPTTSAIKQAEKRITSKPWPNGFAPTDGSGSGRSLALRHEFATIDIDDRERFTSTIDSDVDFTTDGIDYSIAVGKHLLSFQLAAVTCTSASPQSESDIGAIGGLSFASSLARLGRFDWGADLGLSAATLKWDQPNYGESTVGWLQYDLRTGMTYSPSPTSKASLSPRLGLGLRVLDGVQDYSGGKSDFDASAPYVMAGFGAHVRTSASSRLLFDMHGMVGDLCGFEFALSFQF